MTRRPIIPRHEPEVIARLPRHAATSILSSVVYRGVEASSLFSKADELLWMVGMIDAVPAKRRRLVEEMFCDSSMGAAFWINLRSCREGEAVEIAEAIEAFCVEEIGGYNEIEVQSENGTRIEYGPYWQDPAAAALLRM